MGSLLGGSLNGSVGVSMGSLYGCSIPVVSSLNGTLMKRTMKGTHLRYISELRGNYWAFWVSLFASWDSP